MNCLIFVILGNVENVAVRTFVLSGGGRGRTLLMIHPHFDIYPLWFFVLVIINIFELIRLGEC